MRVFSLSPLSRSLFCSLALTGLCAIHPKSADAAPDFLTRDVDNLPLSFSSARDAALEDKKTALVKILDGQKKAGRLRLVADPVYQDSFEGCKFQRKEKVTYYGESFGGTDQTTTSDVEIAVDVTTLTKIGPSFDNGPPDIFSVLFVSDSAAIDVQMQGSVYHHFDQLIAVDDAQTAQVVVEAFNYIANSCKSRRPDVRK
jgi:hypothetical protein